MKCIPTRILVCCVAAGIADAVRAVHSANKTQAISPAADGDGGHIDEDRNPAAQEERKLLWSEIPTSSDEEKERAARSRLTKKIITQRNRSRPNGATHYSAGGDTSTTSGSSTSATSSPDMPSAGGRHSYRPLLSQKFTRTSSPDRRTRRTGRGHAVRFFPEEQEPQSTTGTAGTTITTGGLLNASAEEFVPSIFHSSSSTTLDPSAEEFVPRNYMSKSATAGASMADDELQNKGYDVEQRSSDAPFLRFADIADRITTVHIHEATENSAVLTNDWLWPSRDHPFWYQNAFAQRLTVAALRKGIQHNFPEEFGDINFVVGGANNIKVLPVGGPEDDELVSEVVKGSLLEKVAAERETKMRSKSGRHTRKRHDAFLPGFHSLSESAGAVGTQLAVLQKHQEQLRRGLWSAPYSCVDRISEEAGHENESQISGGGFDACSREPEMIAAEGHHDEGIHVRVSGGTVNHVDRLVGPPYVTAQDASSSTLLYSGDASSEEDGRAA
ncbi:unnamed protein product [Amoebophrya sp. A120]|nr:unnamed protein product [Amoebophrya sp. A120]|eukprot:GSA120T00007503001.1